MKKTYLYLLISLFSVVSFSCDDKDEDQYIMYLDKTSVEIGLNGSRGLVALTANGEWKTSAVPEWLSMSPSSGDGDADITITVATENKELARREAPIVFTRGNVSKTLLVSQLGLSDLSPFIELNKNQVTVGVTECEEKIELRANTSWTVTDLPNWITLDHTSGDKPTQIIIKVKGNDNAEGRASSFTFTNSDGSIKKIFDVEQYGLKDAISIPYLPIFRFKEVRFTSALTHYDFVAGSLFVNSMIAKKIYLGNLLSHNLESNINIAQFTGYTFNPIAISTSAAISGDVAKTYIPSWAEQDAFAKEIIAKKPNQNESFITSNDPVAFYSYKQLHTIGVANLGVKLDQLVSDYSYLDKEMASGYGFIFSFKQTLFTLNMDIPDKLITEELKEADKAKGVSYVSSVSYGKIGLLIVESYSQKVKDAINKVLQEKTLSQEETNLIQTSSVTYVWYNNNNILRAHIGGLDAVEAYQKAISDEKDNIYPIEFRLSNYANNSISDITFALDVPNK